MQHSQQQAPQPNVQQHHH
jgi:hypothetical protein